MFPSRINPGLLDRGVARLLWLLAMLSAALLALVLAFLIIESWPVLNHGGWKNFFQNQSWYPLEGQFGLLPMIAASANPGRI